MQKTLYILLFTCYSLITQAQLPYEKVSLYKHFTVEDGLPSNETYFVFEDSKGFIWIATDRGISRYDGYNFKNYSLEEGTLSTVVFSISEDARGRIWFLPMNGRFFYFENDTFHEYKYNQKLKKFFQNKPFALIHFLGSYFDQGGNLIIATNRFDRISINQNGEINLKLSTPDSYNVILENTSKTSKSKYKELLLKPEYDPNFPNKPLPSQDKLAVQNDSVVQRFVKCFGNYIDSNNYAYSTNNTAHIMINGKLTVKHYPNMITYMYLLGDSSYLIGTPFKGLDFYNGKKRVKRMFDGLSVSDIMEDSYGNLWISSLKDGLFKLVPETNITTYQLDCSVSVIEYLSFSSDSLLIISKRDELFALDLRSGITNKINIGTDCTGNGTPPFAKPISHDKIFFFDKIFDKMEFFSIKNNKGCSRGIHGLIPYNRNQNILFFRDGAFLLDSNHLRINNNSIYSGNRSKAIKLHDGTVLSGSMNGIRFFTGKVFEYYNRFNLKGKRIEVLFEDKQHNLWAGTRGNGVYMISPNDSISQLTTKNGLLSNDINNISEDGLGNLFICSNAGINILNNGKLSSITKSNGLPFNETSILHQWNDTLTFAVTRQYLNVINMAQKIDNVLAPAPFISSISSGDLAYDSLKQNVFPYSSNTLKVDFKSIAPSYTKLIQYQYTLSNSKTEKKKWTKTKLTNAQLYNLQAGEYTFLVRAKIGEGNWSSISSISFNIKPPFYQTTLFVVSIVLFVSLSVIALVFYRFKYLNRQKELESNLNLYKSKSLSSQMNPHFIFNALNSIQTFVLQNNKEDANKYLAQFASLIRNTFENSKNNFIPLSRELETVQLYFDLENLRLQHRLSLSIKNSNVLENQTLIAPLLIQPIIENAVVHGLTPKLAKGKIEIELWKDDHFLYFSIQDDGVGRYISESIKRRKKLKKSSSGIEMVKNRIALMSNKKLIESVEVKDLVHANGNAIGTRVLLKIPLILRNDEH